MGAARGHEVLDRVLDRPRRVVPLEGVGGLARGVFVRCCQKIQVPPADVDLLGAGVELVCLVLEQPVTSVAVMTTAANNHRWSLTY